MQRLHLVGLTEDADGLIFSTRRGAKSGGFVVTVDPDLMALLQDAASGGAPPKAKSNGRGPSRAPHTGVRPDSQLSPREMQELLRAGWTLEEVAAEAGVDVDWVGRFAAPVMAEIQRVVDQAVEAVFDKPRVGASSLPLGPSVRRNLAERGVRLTDEDFADGWRAHQLDDVTWVVTFTYTSRGRPQEATWAIDLDEDALVARNRLGTQLGHVGSIRRKVSTAPPPKPKPAASAVKKVAKKKAAPAPAPARRAAPAKSRATKATKKMAATPAKKTARSPRASKTTAKAKKKAGASKRTAARGKRPDVVVSAPIDERPPPRPNTTSDVYRDELRRRLELEAADRPRPRPPTPEPELPTPRPPVRGPMPPPAPLAVPAVVREKVAAAPLGTFDIEHDRKDDLDDSPFAAEAWYPKADESRPVPRPTAPRTEAETSPPARTPHAAPRPEPARRPAPAPRAERPTPPGPRPHPPTPAPPAPSRPKPPAPRPEPPAPRPAPRPEPPGPNPPPAPAPARRAVISAEPAAAPSTPVFKGARPATTEPPARPRRREPLRAR